MPTGEDLARQMLEEFYASNPVGKVKYQCLELKHPAFVDESGNPGVIRLVNNRITPLTVRLETGALATFRPGGYSVRLPPKGTHGRRDLQFVMDVITTEVMEQMERVSDWPERKRIETVLREYTEGNLEYPGRIDDRLTLIKPRAKGVRVQASAVFNDTINKSVPSINYQLATHPGLANSA